MSKKGRGATALFNRVTELQATVDFLRDALTMTIEAAHDSGRVASRGRLHPTSSFDECSSMLCEHVRLVLGERAGKGSE